MGGRRRRLLRPRQPASAGWVPTPQFVLSGWATGLLRRGHCLPETRRNLSLTPSPWQPGRTPSPSHWQRSPGACCWPGIRPNIDFVGNLLPLTMSVFQCPTPREVCRIPIGFSNSPMSRSSSESPAARLRARTLIRVTGPRIFNFKFPWLSINVDS
jgi:hypothetical protein